MKASILATTVLTFVIGLPVASSAGLAPDGDSDGIPDVLDNCSALPNASPADCDTDVDGYGNGCDGDFNNDFSTDGADYGGAFLPDFTGPGTDSGTGTDMNCDGVVDGADYGGGFLPQFTGQATPGPSGLRCAGTPPCP